MSQRTRRRGTASSAVRIEGALFSPELLARIRGAEAGISELTPESYHLPSGQRLGEAMTAAWNEARSLARRFYDAQAKADPSDPAVQRTRQDWLLPLFQILGYGRLQAATLRDAEGQPIPLSHLWSAVPIHLVGTGVDLDRRTKGVAGAATRAPHALVQELLNERDEYLWGIVSNGKLLRLLRDNASFTRQAYVEFDLQSIFEGESYPDFTLLWLLLHVSSLETKPVRDEDGEAHAAAREACRLERWSKQAAEQGTRVREQLREGVKGAIEALGRGFLAHPKNEALRAALATGALTTQDYYRELLRLAYRLIFLFVAEDRDLLLDPTAPDDAQERYREHYATTRLRRRAARTRGTRHDDAWQGLALVMRFLGQDEGCPSLALPALGSFLWSADALPHLAHATLDNAALYEALRKLTTFHDGQRRQLVDWRNLGSEELGSVYESLLELVPDAHRDAATFDLKEVFGSERKTSGSYYTPTSLIACLLESALDPVVDQALQGKRGPEAERALLALKVCDPACGSGHFLVAAAHRLAHRLALVRSSDEEPTPSEHQRALRDVVAHCIYGVDLNPMAVELCKVSLWMEAMEPGRPLAFLESRILRGNSLLGTTPALLAAGLPDAAFTALEGDDKKLCNQLRKLNREERDNQQSTLLYAADAGEVYGSIAQLTRELERIDDRTIAGIHAKELRYRARERSPELRRARLAADAWCATFVWPKNASEPEPPTSDLLRLVAADPKLLPEKTRATAERLAEEYAFFHWHLAFPEVFRMPEPPEVAENAEAGWSGGFDVVLGNPPWERVKLEEKQFFAARAPSIANARNKAERQKEIAKLEQENSGLLREFHAALRRAEGESHFIRTSERFPLCGRGDVNTYAVFAETNRSIIQIRGRAGCILPTGIATDDTTKAFFRSLVDDQALVSLYGFQNEEYLFPAVYHRTTFCLLTMGGSAVRCTEADLLFLARRLDALADPERHFQVTADDIALLNPNTRTCPVFRSRRDAEITKKIYRRVPVLLREGPPEENPWSVSFQRLFDMSNDSHLFRGKEQLERDGFGLDGNVFARGTERYVPLYEAKMLHHFTHRYGDYAYYPPGAQTTSLPDVPTERLQDQHYAVLPRYWVAEPEVDERLRERWGRGWLLGWRDICRNTDERTVIATVMPRFAVGDKFLLMFSGASPSSSASLLANLDALAFDYCSRQKLGGTSLKYYTMRQLPVLPPSDFERMCPWMQCTTREWILPLVLELTYTSWDLQPFGQDCGYDGPPFRWDEERRFLLRAELDAAFFHLYGLTRDETEYVLGTFPIVERHDRKAFGEYRTKRVVLEVYDAMARAVEAGTAYVTRLVPGPADPRVAHPARGEAKT